jgi:hypothetical protein
MSQWFEFEEEKYQEKEIETKNINQVVTRSLQRKLDQPTI